MATRLADPGTPPPRNSPHDGQGCRRCFCLDLNPTWGLRASGLCTHGESCMALPGLPVL